MNGATYIYIRNIQEYIPRARVKLAYRLKQNLKLITLIIYSKANTLQFLNLFLISRDFIKSVYQGPPFGVWTKTFFSWIIFSFSAAIRKSLTYLMPCREKKLLELARKNSVESGSDNEPLVSIIIPTYNRAKLLLERAIPSVLNQTYKNLEVIVVGDHCTDNTEKEIKKIGDPRVRFINLPERGKYPKEPIQRWFVAGVVPVNVGLQESRGEWIAHLDDDDEFSPDHVDVLLKFALEHDYEMVYGVVEMEMSDGSWVKVGSPDLREGAISRISALYRGYLKCFRCDINSWKMREPADFNLWRRMKRAGVRIGFINKVVGKHYRERTQINV